MTLTIPIWLIAGIIGVIIGAALLLALVMWIGGDGWGPHF